MPAWLVWTQTSIRNFMSPLITSAGNWSTFKFPYKLSLHSIPGYLFFKHFAPSLVYGNTEIKVKTNMIRPLLFNSLFCGTPCQTEIHISRKPSPVFELATWYDVIYLLTAIVLKHGGSSTVHIYTKQYTEHT